jgi:hypothetical protein
MLFNRPCLNGLSYMNPKLLLVKKSRCVCVCKVLTSLEELIMRLWKIYKTKGKSHALCCMATLSVKTIPLWPLTNFSKGKTNHRMVWHKDYNTTGASAVTMPYPKSHAINLQRFSFLLRRQSYVQMLCNVITNVMTVRETDSQILLEYFH